MKLTWDATVAIPPETLFRHSAIATSLSHFAISPFADACLRDLAAATLATGFAVRDLQLSLVTSLFARPRVLPSASCVGLVRAIYGYVFFK